MLARQLGRVDYFTQQQTNELFDLKKRLGFDDPRFHVENCDLCGNSAFRDGYKEQLPQPQAFDAAPDYPGYLASSKAGSTSAPSKNGRTSRDSSRRSPTRCCRPWGRTKGK